MKQKIFCMLAIICCMSFFSAAKQNGKKCDNSLPRPANSRKYIKETGWETGFDLSPLRFFVLTM
jgi:hypothetical protein